RRPRGNAHGTEAGAVADAPPLLRDDELYRESDRHAPARHAEHQTLARWRHAPAVDRARPAARRGAFPVHQAPWRARRARDGPRHRHVRGARRVSPRGHRRRKRAATIGSGSIFSPGAAMSVIPRAAVNGRYDGLPPHSAKFNSERDNPSYPHFHSYPQASELPRVTRSRGRGRLKRRSIRPPRARRQNVCYSTGRAGLEARARAFDGGELSIDISDRVLVDIDPPSNRWRQKRLV